jgi:DNA-binding MarR family transcriptional regulator
MDLPKARHETDRIGTFILSPLHKAYRQAILYMEGQDCGINAGVGSSEIHLLAYIRRFGPCPISEISRVFGHKKSTVTSMLDRLVEKGYITREVNPDDRRTFMLSIRPEGDTVARAAGALVERFEREVAARISEDDLAGFRRVLTAISAVTGVEVRRPDR